MIEGLVISLFLILYSSTSHSLPSPANTTNPTNHTSYSTAWNPYEFQPPPPPTYHSPWLPPEGFYDHFEPWIADIIRKRVQDIILEWRMHHLPPLYHCRYTCEQYIPSRLWPPPANENPTPTPPAPTHENSTPTSIPPAPAPAHENSTPTSIPPAPTPAPAPAPAHENSTPTSIPPAPAQENSTPTSIPPAPAPANENSTPIPPAPAPAHENSTPIPPAPAPAPAPADENSTPTPIPPAPAPAPAHDSPTGAPPPSNSAYNCPTMERVMETCTRMRRHATVNQAYSWSCTYSDECCKVTLNVHDECSNLNPTISWLKTICCNSTATPAGGETNA